MPKPEECLIISHTALLGQIGQMDATPLTHRRQMVRLLCQMRLTHQLSTIEVVLSLTVCEHEDEAFGQDCTGDRGDDEDYREIMISTVPPACIRLASPDLV